MFEFKLIDKGYNKHKNDFCSARSQLSNKQYLDEHVKTIQQKLNTVDIKITQSGIKNYLDFLEPHSELSILIEPHTSFSVADFSYYKEQEIRDKLNLKLEVNNKSVPIIFNDWDLGKIQTLSLKTQLPEKTETIPKRFKTVVIKRQFRQEDLSNAENFVGYNVKVIRNNGKESVGKLKRIYKERLYIAMNIQKGTFEVSVKIKDIKDFSVYR